MKKKHAEQSDELAALFKKVIQNPNSVSETDKKRMKKLISDPDLMIEAMQKTDPNFDMPAIQADVDTHTIEEIISNNYIALAKFAIKKMQLNNVYKLKVKEFNGYFIIYALTPEPLELCFDQFATSDYPYYKELLHEAEAMMSDLLNEKSDRQFISEIINYIESVDL